MTLPPLVARLVPSTKATRMNDSDHPGSVFRPGEHVLVWVMGTWLPGQVVGTEPGGRVVTRYRRLDGDIEDRSFSAASVMPTARRS